MADLELLLTKTSRTFALTIPLLPDPTRRAVTIAYLLFRVADTLEDAHRWGRDARVIALRRFAALLRRPTTEEANTLAVAWLEARPCDHEGYLELLTELPALLDALAALPDAARRSVTAHTLRTIGGMEGFVAEGEEDGSLQLDSLDRLRQYCYVVAGIVGELLTELVLAAEPRLASEADELRRLAPRFGEALQLVNILKDADDDARDGRVYLPDDVPRAELFALAHRDLDLATRYVERLQAAGASHGLVSFHALPVLLARPTLDRVETQGAGAKLTRAEVTAIVMALDEALAAGQRAIEPG